MKKLLKLKEWYNYSMENLNFIIAKNLATLRRKNKLTQLELAQKLNYSDKAISKWEKGESLPSVEVLHTICKLYGVSMDYMVGDEKKEPKIIETETLKKRYLNITLLSILAVWFVGLVLFVSFDIFTHKDYFIIFAWAVPASAVVSIIFDSIWNKCKLLFYLLTVLLWSLLISVTIQFLTFNIWKILLIGIPLQIAIYLWSRLAKK